MVPYLSEFMPSLPFSPSVSPSFCDSRGTVVSTRIFDLAVVLLPIRVVATP